MSSQSAAEAHCEVCLRIEINAQHLLTLPDKGGGEVYGGGCLSDAALLIDDCDYLGHGMLLSVLWY